MCLLETLIDPGRPELYNEWVSPFFGAHVTRPPARRRELVERELLHLYGIHARALFRYALRHVRDRELAKDGIQEVFLRYYVSRLDGCEIHNAKSWLFRVLRNFLVDRLRERWLKSGPSIEEVEHLPDSGPGPQARIERNEALERIEGSLAPRELECLRLRAEGLSYSEIASTLQVRSGTVGALLARGAKKIDDLRLTIDD